MKRFRILLPATLILLVIGVSIVVSMHRSAMRRDGENHASASFFADSFIEVAAPQRHDFLIHRRWFGRAQSKEAIKITALVSGRVDSVAVPDETPVRKGRLLLSLGGPRIQKRLKALRAKVASLAEREAIAGQILAMKKEAVALRVSKRTDLLSAKDNLSRLRSELMGAKQELTSFQDCIWMRSPIEGVFTRRRIDLGQEVEEGDTLAEIIRPDSVRIVATLFPPHRFSLAGLRAAIDTEGRDSILGVVTRVLPERTSEGGVVVWIEGDDINRNVAPGEYLSGDIVVSARRNAIAVPEAAVIKDQDERAFVLLKVPKGYIKRAVKIGVRSGGWIEVRSGIKDADSVVVQGAYELFYRDFNKTYKVKD